jgi:methylated-DNA-[protein]-cysteine S-methyltransferase
VKLFIGRIDSPLGVLVVVTDEQGVLRALDIGDRVVRLTQKLSELYGQHEMVVGEVPGDITRAMRAYFEGDFAAIDAIAVADAGTDLQKRVWGALRRIPAGTTTSYGELARSLGFDDPRAAVDIGAANGANPFAIVVPCHRVIAKNGDLRGYAWGIHRKAALLEHEGALPKKVSPVAEESARLYGF